MNISLTKFVVISLLAAFVGSLAALYVGYRIGQKQIQQQVNANPILKLFA